MTATAAIHQSISQNPATGEIFAHYPFDTPVEIEQALTRSAGATWRQVLIEDRAAFLLRLAAALDDRKEELATMMTQEMRKPIAQARAEVEKCAFLCEWYAEHGPKFLESQIVEVDKGQARQEFRPLGPILAVMPWNFPAWQVLRGAAGMLLAGNTYVLKHAPNVMGSAYLLRDTIAAAGAPEGLFEVIHTDPEGLSSMIEDPRIVAVAVTGSVRAGAAIARQAGAVLKKSILELGGSDTFVVLADADLDAAVRSAVTGRSHNTGQVCLAAKRIIAEQPIAEAFEARFVEAAQALKVGDQLQEDAYIGPMARYDLRDEVHRQVEESVAQGARRVMGGQKLGGAGNFYAPTVLADVRPGMVAFGEELFGPVASLIVARDAARAVELANDSECGLGGTIWTGDVDKADRTAARIETGSVFINGDVASDPWLAVGSVKKSGFGRERSSCDLYEVCNVPTVWIDRR